MSDRPMRLKYLTKMKIILCIFLLCITAVSVFGEPQELNGIVGESVKFPAAVKIQGSLIHSGVTIGIVTSGRFTAPRDGEYSDRVHWDSSTGLFSLSGLRLKDSGIYTVQDTQQTSVSTFNLTVWEDNVPVSKPHVSITHNEYPCTIECTAERGTGVTLSWYREGEKKPYVSSPVESAPHLHLPQTVERSGTYTCEAKNSVSNEKASITVGDHCTAGFSAGTIVAIIFAVGVGIIAVVALFTAGFFALKYRREAQLKEIYNYVKKLAEDEARQEIIQEDEASLGLIQGGNRSKHPTKDGTRSELEGIRKELEVVRRTIQDEQAVLREAVKKSIQDEQAVLREVVRRTIQDEQAVLRDAVRTLNEVMRSKQPDKGEQELKDFQDYLDACKLDPNKPPIVYDVVTIKSQDEGEQAIKDGTDMSDRSDEPKNGTPQTGSYTINPQP